VKKKEKKKNNISVSVLAIIILLTITITTLLHVRIPYFASSNNHDNTRSLLEGLQV